MNTKSLIAMSILAMALHFSPLSFGQETNEGMSGRGRRWQNRMANLSADDREKLKATRYKAIQDPNVQAALEKMRQARREFTDSMRAAMLKADPSIQSVLDKMPGPGRGGREED
jgi:hypothetical protein